MSGDLKPTLVNTTIVIGDLWRTNLAVDRFSVKLINNLIEVVDHIIATSGIKIEQIVKYENNDNGKQKGNADVLSRLNEIYNFHTWPNTIDKDVVSIWSLAMCLSCAKALDDFAKNRYNEVLNTKLTETAKEARIKEISESTGIFVLIFEALKCVYRVTELSQRKYRLREFLKYCKTLTPSATLSLSGDAINKIITESENKNALQTIFADLDHLWSPFMPDSEIASPATTTVQTNEDETTDSIDLESIVIEEQLPENSSSNQNSTVSPLNRVSSPNTQSSKQNNIPSFTKAPTPSVTKTPVGFGSGTSKGSNAPNRTNTLSPLQLPETAENETKPKSAIQKLADAANKTLNQIRKVNQSPTLPSKSDQKIEPLVNPNPPFITTVTQTFGGNRNRSRSQDPITTQPTSVFSAGVSPKGAATLKHPLEEMTTADWNSLFAFIATRAS